MRCLDSLTAKTFISVSADDTPLAVIIPRRCVTLKHLCSYCRWCCYLGVRVRQGTPWGRVFLWRGLMETSRPGGQCKFWHAGTSHFIKLGHCCWRLVCLRGRSSDEMVTGMAESALKVVWDIWPPPAVHPIERPYLNEICELLNFWTCEPCSCLPLIINSYSADILMQI